jgi:PAS domain S-box-containing protein
VNVEMSVAAPLVQISLLGEAIDGAPVAVLVADDEGRYLAANRYACELLGYSREELLTKSVRDVAVGDDVEAHFQDLIAVREQRGTSDVRRKDGTITQLRYRAGRTMLAGMTCYIAVCVEVDAPESS